MALKNNTWKVNQWYDQAVAGNVIYNSPIAGEFWSWGDNEHGVLGLNQGPSNNNRSSPTQVGSDATWSVLNTGGSETVFQLAVKSDGTLWGWEVINMET